MKLEKPLTDDEAADFITACQLEELRLHKTKFIDEILWALVDINHDNNNYLNNEMKWLSKLGIAITNNDAEAALELLKISREY